MPSLHETHRLSRKPIARAPLEMRGIQKALTQLKGRIMDHHLQDPIWLFFKSKMGQDLEALSSVIADNPEFGLSR